MLRISLIAPVVALLAALAIVGCGGDDDSSSDSGGPAVSTQPPANASTTVTAVDFGFRPNALTAKVGQATTVNLNNTGAVPHTFTIAGLADSGTVAAGQSKSISFTPTSAGTLTYICTIHGAAAMSGTVTVTQ